MQVLSRGTVPPVDLARWLRGMNNIRVDISTYDNALYLIHPPEGGVPLWQLARAQHGIQPLANVASYDHSADCDIIRPAGNSLAPFLVHLPALRRPESWARWLSFSMKGHSLSCSRPPLRGLACANDQSTRRP